MPLHVKIPPEPLSLAARDEPSRLASSPAAEQLRATLSRYLRREIPGRSFLISGSRGSGKTTLVRRVVHDLDIAAQADATARHCRPLYVRLHAPSLLRSKEELQAEFSRRQPKPKKGESQAIPILDKGSRQTFETELVLEELAKQLYVAVADCFEEAFRARIRESEQLNEDSKRPDALELAAQLKLQLYEDPEVAKLRQFWFRAGRLDKGVLCAEPRAWCLDDQGMLEIVALATAAQVFRRINNKITHTTESRSEAGETNQASAGAGTSLKDVAQPLLPILTGGAVGTGVGVALADQGILAVIAAIATGLAAAIAVQVSYERRSSRTVAEEYVLYRDFSSRSLMRILPVLVIRLCRAGLAPVFVVDELDKVRTIHTRLNALGLQLKQFMGEDVFVCFLTDRKYYEEMRQEMAKGYGANYTMFSDTLYVVHDLKDIFEYLKFVISK